MTKFCVSVDSDSWDGEIGGWRCPALAIPGARLEAAFADGQQLDPGWFQALDSKDTIRWVRDDAPPQKIRIQIGLTKKLSTQELTTAWKKAAILLPFVGAILSLLVTTGFGNCSLFEDDPQYTTWTVRGHVEKGAFEPGDVVGCLQPPDLRLMDDYTFEQQIPIDISCKDRPALVFRFKDHAGGIPTKVSHTVHLVTDNEEGCQLGSFDYHLKIDEDERVIEIQKPLDFGVIHPLYQTDAPPPERTTMAMGG